MKWYDYIPIANRSAARMSSTITKGYDWLVKTQMQQEENRIKRIEAAAEYEKECNKRDNQQRLRSLQVQQNERDRRDYLANVQRASKELRETLPTGTLITQNMINQQISSGFTYNRDVGEAEWQDYLKQQAKQEVESLDPLEILRRGGDTNQIEEQVFQDLYREYIYKKTPESEKQELLRKYTSEMPLWYVPQTQDVLPELFELAMEPMGSGLTTQEVAQPVVQPYSDKIWQNLRTGEALTQEELYRRFPTGSEAGLDEFTLTREAATQYPVVFRAFGRGLTMLPKQLAASILQAFQGINGASVVDRDWADRYIQDAQTDIEKFVEEMEPKDNLSFPIKLTDVAQLPQNMAYSLTSMGAGLAVGIPTAMLPLPGARIAAWGLGTVASGVIAYRMTTYQIMQQYLEFKDYEKRLATGKGLTQAEEDKLKKEFNSEAVKYGLWEAVPEAIGNLAFAQILTGGLTHIVGKKVATGIIGKLAAMYGEELLTETITQKGQSAIEVGAGLRENNITWWEALKEVAPQTFLLTTVMAGAGQVSTSSWSKIRNSLHKEIKPGTLRDTLEEGLKDAVDQQSGEITLPETTPTAPEVKPTEQPLSAEKEAIPQTVAPIEPVVPIEPTQPAPAKATPTVQPTQPVVPKAKVASTTGGITIPPSLNEQAVNKYGKDFNTISTAQRAKILQESEESIITDDIDYATKKIGLAGRGFENPIDSRPALVYGGLTKGVVADGFLLIKDKAIADEVLGKIIEASEKQAIKRSYLPYKEAERIEKEDTKRQIEEYKDHFPKIEELFPEDKGVPVSLKGVAQTEGISTAILSGEKVEVAVNLDKLAFMLKYLPDAEIRATSRSTPVHFVVNGEDKGVLMPMSVSDATINKVIPTTSVISTETEAQPVVPSEPEATPVATKQDNFNPKNLKTPEGIVGEGEKLVKQSEIAKTLSEMLNVPIHKGKFRGGAVGIYKKQSQIIRIKRGQLQTVSHEIGHHLDQNLNLSSLVPKKELDSLLSEYKVTESTPKGREALAEFIRYYITEPVKAKARAPQFYVKFQNSMKEYPEISRVIETAKDDYQRWLSMPATAKILSHESMSETSNGKLRDTWNSFYTAMGDNLYSLRKFSEKIKKSTDFDVEDDPYTAARLLAGNTARANVFLNFGTFGAKYWQNVDKKTHISYKGKSLKDVLRPLKEEKTWGDFSAYVTAKRVIELSSRKIETGIDLETARQSVKELDVKYPQFSKIASDLYTYNKHLLEYAYEQGLISKESLQKILKVNTVYVPFHRVQEELARRGYLGKKMADVISPIKRIIGDEAEIINPLESIVKDTYSVIGAADRNKVGILMAQLASKSKEAGRMFEKIPANITKIATVKPEDISRLGIPEELIEDAIDIFRPSFFKPKGDVVTVIENGEKSYYQTTPELYNTLLSLNEEHMHWLLKLMSLPARTLRAGAILNPEFMIRNPARDQLSAFIYSKYGFVPVFDFIRGVSSIIKKDEYFQMFQASGAEHSMLVSMDRENLKQTFSEVVNGKRKVDYVKHPLELLQILSELGEKGTRLGEFILAVRKTGSPVQAGIAARNVTLDFQQKGNIAKVLNAIIPFWNANIRDWGKITSAFKERPIETSMRVFAGVTFPSMVLYLNNRDDPRWKEIPQWQKDLFWIIFTENHTFRIPKPFMTGWLFGSGVERFLEYIDTKDKKILSEWIKSGQNVMLPGYIPQLFLPLIENASNYNIFLDRPIVSEGREGMIPELQYGNYTSETAKKMGEVLNYSPAKIENLISEWTGGLGKYAVSALDKILKGTGISEKIPEPSPTLADLPIIKAFVVRSPYGSSSESLTRFYEELKKYQANEQYLKEQLKYGNQDKFAKFKAQHPELLFQYDDQRNDFYSMTARYLRGVASDLSEIRKKEDLIYKDKTMTPQEKRKLIDELEKLKSEYAKLALSHLDWR